MALESAESGAPPQQFHEIRHCESQLIRAQLLIRSQNFMATICWRGREFKANCQRLDARASGVCDEDVVLLGELLAAGEFGSLETLWLVSSYAVFLCPFCAPSRIEWSCLR